MTICFIKRLMFMGRMKAKELISFTASEEKDEDVNRQIKARFLTR